MIIKRKVFECKRQVAEHESMYTDRFRSYIQVLQRIHLKFDPIVCFSADSSLLYFYPCQDFLRNRTCNVFSIRKRVPFNNVQQAYCKSCYLEAKKNDVSCDTRDQRSAPNIRVPILSLNSSEKVEKIHRMIVEREKFERTRKSRRSKNPIGKTRCKFL
jgi:hypothetical protein